MGSPGMWAVSLERISGAQAQVPSFWLVPPKGRPEEKSLTGLATPSMDNTGAVFVSRAGTFTSDGSRVCVPCVVIALDAGSEMVTLGTIARCPRCRSRPTVQSVVALRPGVEYLTLRCASCGLVYDAQVPSDPTRPATLAEAKPLG
jgi:hypothetical protein